MFKFLQKLKNNKADTDLKESVLKDQIASQVKLAQTYKNHLLFFYGEGCEHCINEEGIVNALQEQGTIIQKIEVWNNKENDSILEKLDCGPDACGGIPFFYNQKNQKTLCGEVTKEEILEWAK